MKRTKKIAMLLSSEQIRMISGATGSDINAGDTVRTLDLTSNISAKSGCQGTQYCCKPP